MTHKANILKVLRQACCILLLALYGVAALKVDSFHALFHSKEVAELHSPVQENNPCHKSIYHQQSQKGCEHKSHITENTKCPLCEYNVTPDQLVENQVAQTDVIKIIPYPTTWVHVVETSTELSIPARGPPSNV